MSARLRTANPPKSWRKQSQNTQRASVEQDNVSVGKSNAVVVASEVVVVIVAGIADDLLLEPLSVACCLLVFQLGARSLFAHQRLLVSLFRFRWLPLLLANCLIAWLFGFSLSCLLAFRSQISQPCRQQ